MKIEYHIAHKTYCRLHPNLETESYARIWHNKPTFVGAYYFLNKKKNIILCDQTRTWASSDLMIGYNSQESPAERQLHLPSHPSSSNTEAVTDCPLR